MSTRITTARLPKVPFTIKIKNDRGWLFANRMFTVTSKRMDVVTGDLMIKLLESDGEHRWDQNKMNFPPAHFYSPN